MGVAKKFWRKAGEKFSLGRITKLGANGIHSLEGANVPVRRLVDIVVDTFGQDKKISLGL